MNRYDLTWTYEGNTFVATLYTRSDALIRMRDLLDDGVTSITLEVR